MSIFNTEISYFKEYSFACYANCLRQVMEYYKILNAPFYINSTLNLELHMDSRLKYGIDIGVDPQYFLLQNNIQFHKYDVNEDSYNVWLNNKKAILADTPLITAVDLFYLPYQQYYRKSHSLHCVILCGYNNINDSVSIIDWHEPWFFKGEVKKEVFLQARGSKNEWDGGISSGKPICNMWTRINKTGWKFNELELIYKTINTSIKQYYNAYVNSDLQINGIYGLEKLYNILDSYKKNNNSELILYIHNKLFFLKIRWNLFKLYLQFSALVLKTDTIFQTINQTIKIIESWQLLLMSMLKTTYSDTQNNYMKMLQFLKNNIELQNMFYGTLYKLERELN